MPLRIFRSRPIVAANAIQILSVAGMFGMFFLGALYLRRVLGLRRAQIGLAFLPATSGWARSRSATRTGSSWPSGRAGRCLSGLTLILAGLAAVRDRAGARELPDSRWRRRCCCWARCRHGVPGADERRDDGSHPAGRGPRIGPRQHHRPGRRGARPRRARDALDVPQQRAQSERRLHRLGADVGLSPRVLGRGRARRAARWSWCSRRSTGARAHRTRPSAHRRERVPTRPSTRSRRQRAPAPDRGVPRVTGAPPAAPLSRCGAPGVARRDPSRIRRVPSAVGGGGAGPDDQRCGM